MKPNYLAKARAAWGDNMSAEVSMLAEEAERTTADKVAKRIGYSGAVVSQVISNKYPGDVERVKAKIRGALMNATVMCPAVGEIALDYCLDQQKMPNTGASSVRALIYRNCRGLGVQRCVHSRIKEDDNVGN
ncbi:transcriptional regulator [Bradyrhizobium quebecense]|uniref:Transcriptional regulator n=1 Tax=Bradyrhizobium quebecense TaxID=2748629 RepID=A0A974AHI9_9BRAD|nr:transcriptional regulator [Bradyrhizobium quebecense]UGA45982.1 transcriptional regulator [Bradyrhizobium quebecense]